MRVLIIEDDKTDMKLFSAVLEADEHRVVGMGSAEQAVVEIKLHHPEVILLDLNLPGMNGLALARLLKRDPATSHIPIVATTADGGEFSKEVALAAGCDAFIVKPVDTRRLSHQITQAAAISPSVNLTP
jgi:CheY-like chemotaxis protein